MVYQIRYMTTNQQIRLTEMMLLDSMEETKVSRKLVRNLRALKLKAVRENLSAVLGSEWTEWSNNRNASKKAA